ncbi:hypothetical protein B0H19DRAFT_1074370 [Mycena capillaripes]|nr:hypothetical protein B0H19DRAFT_1074370 [Mycena capillaripes]
MGRLLRVSTIPPELSFFYSRLPATTVLEFPTPSTQALTRIRLFLSSANPYAYPMTQCCALHGPEKNVTLSGTMNVPHPNGTASSAVNIDSVGLNRGSTFSNPDSDIPTPADTSARQRLKRNPRRKD